MTHTSSLVRVVASTALLAGCMTARQRADYNAMQLERALRRAAHDLHCESRELRATPVEYGDGYHDKSWVVVGYGVRGCGRQAVYIRDPEGNWLLNSSPVLGGRAEGDSTAPRSR